MAAQDADNVAKRTQRVTGEHPMEYRIQLATPSTNLSAIDDVIREIDPAACVDQDPADGCLRVTAWLSAEELAQLLAASGYLTQSIVLQPSVCCGDCSG